MDRHVYAWHADGTPVAGFPVLLVDPAKVQAVDPVSNKVTFTPSSGVGEGGEIVATPTVADVNGDGRLEIVVGAQEQYVEPTNIGDGADVLGLLGSAGTPGNSRLYVVSPDGTNAGYPNTSANPDAQAYLPGWPAKLSQLATGLLPTIGDGVAMQAVVGDVDPGHPGPEIVAASSAGTLYVLDDKGRSVYGSTGSGDLPVAWAGGLVLQNSTRFGALRNSNDIVASLIGLSGPTVGELQGGGAEEIAANTAGLTRFIDLLAPDLQLPDDDQLSAWNGQTGDELPGSPHTTADLGLFIAPAIADLDADGNNEMIAGNGLYMLDAVNAQGAEPSGWPKLTGGWSIGTPAVGDWDGDGHLEVAQQRRDGYLLVWRTKGTGAAAWGSYGCDSYNSGGCANTSAAVVAPPTTTTTTAATGTTTAPASSEAAAGTTTSTGGGSLPLTGTDSVVLLLAAAALVTAGTALVGWRRRLTLRAHRVRSRPSRRR